MMIVYEPMEIIITPETTYIAISYMSGDFRRIYTDGRKRPEKVELTYAGYSIGQWVDESGSGRYDTLLVETRDMRGPRIFEASGIPLHKDNQTIVKERIRLDKANPDLMLNDITTIDNALTRPWTVTRQYRRERNPSLGRLQLRRGQHVCLCRKRNLFHRRRRQADAHPQGPAAAGSAAFQPAAGQMTMLVRSLMAVAGLAVMLSAAGAPALDQSKYPDWKGQWNRKGGGTSIRPSASVLRKSRH